MAFNPGSYKPSEPKALPVVLLLDVSGSMEGEKICSLHDAVVEMVNTFVQQRASETLIKLSIITFGDKKVELHAPSTSDSPYVDIADVQQQGIPMFNADGSTPLGCALKMAKDMIDDKSVTMGRWYAPAVVLVSDGQPNDTWRQPLSRFINDGRSSRCQRLAIAIGNDADIKVLREFTGNENLVFYAEHAGQIASEFKKVTLSITNRASQSNPDAGLPNVPGTFDPSPSSAARPTAARPTAARPTAARPTATRPTTTRPTTTRPTNPSQPAYDPDEDF